MEPRIPSEYCMYSFILKQLDSGPTGAFSIYYKDKEIATYDGIVPLVEIKKSQIKYNYDPFLPMEFLKFSNDYLNFRMIISNKCYIYTHETKQEFFFNYDIFGEYDSQIQTIIYEGLKKINSMLSSGDESIEELGNSFPEIHPKIISIIERVYNHQRNYSLNPIINSRIHVVVSLYPAFGFYYDILKYKLGLFEENLKPVIENDFHLIINKKKANQKDWAQFFGNTMEIANWKAVAELFHWSSKSLKSSLATANSENKEEGIRKRKIDNMITEYYKNLP